MKVIVEIETDDDMERVEKFIKFLQPALIKNTLEKANKVREFMDFIDNEAIVVEKIMTPNREPRNAR